MKVARLNFYGVRLIVRGPDELIARIESDFGYFATQSFEEASFEIVVHTQNQRPAGWYPAWKTRWSTLYLSIRERRVCFFGKAWVAYRFESGHCEIYCDDPAVAFEVSYLVVLSAVGEELDRRGIHRVHGMGLCRDGRGILFLGASGVGKSTLALEFLRDGISRILSDDTPLIDEFGGMTAFPQRIALSERPDIDSRFIHTFARARFKEKFVIGCDYFRDRIQPTVLTDAVVYLKRDKTGTASLEELSRSELFLLLLRWLVVGHEIPQIWQLYLRFSPLSLWWKTRILVSRLRCAWAIAKRSRPWKVHLGDSAKTSVHLLEQWLTEGTLQTRTLGSLS